MDTCLLHASVSWILFLSNGDPKRFSTLPNWRSGRPCQTQTQRERTERARSRGHANKTMQDISYRAVQTDFLLFSCRIFLSSPPPCRTLHLVVEASKKNLRQPWSCYSPVQLLTLVQTLLEITVCLNCTLFRIKIFRKVLASMLCFEENLLLSGCMSFVCLRS